MPRARDTTTGEGRPTAPVHRRAEPSPARPLEVELGFRLGRAHRALRDAWGAQIADLGLTPPQAAMLRAVCERPGTGVRDLGRRTRTDPMNAKRLVDHLERAGLLESVADPGHRQRRLLRPTGTGEELAAAVSRRAARWDRHLTRLVGAGEVRALRGLLDRLEGALAPTPDPRGEEGGPPGRVPRA